MADLAGETTELLSQLIRNECVNDGTPDSGWESRSADLLSAYLDVPGLDLRQFEPYLGRASLLARLEGTDPASPTLMLMGHTDVVPANPEGWLRDPFGGEVVDGEVWGRGAIDMLSLTASMAVAMRHLALEKFRPAGTLLYLAVADEEAGGSYGAEWLVEHHLDAVRCDYLLTEPGAFRMPMAAPGTLKLPVTVAEKGAFWCTLRARGTPGHGSRPWRTDNALVKAAQVVGRLAAYRPEAHIPEVWRRFVEGMADGADHQVEDTAALLDPERIGALVETHPDVAWARLAQACTHTTIAPTVLEGGIKRNVIPDLAEIQLDIRILPGQRGGEVPAMLQDALGDLWGSVKVVIDAEDPPTDSPVDTPLWDALQRASGSLVPGSSMVPFLAAGLSDARFFRLLGTTAYGFGLYSDRLSFSDFASLVHGDNERIDIESLRLCAELWPRVARDLLGEPDRR
jgi:acetylornithine deacetylase/succinyl-diaminopimelate desuccinylase-like protein